MQKKIALGARLLLGLIFVVFGLNFFLHFIPVPPPNEAAGSFLGALFATGYMFPLIKVIEIVTGALLLAGFFVPLALLLLAPIVVNIALVHFILDTGGAPIAAVTSILTLIVAWDYKNIFAHVLKAKN
jgi:putative oxidoreductase